MLTAYRRYFDFAGRASRSEFWLFYLWIALGVGSLVVGNSVAVRLTDSQPLNLAFGAAYILFMAVSVIPLLAVAARRLHDSNRSALWLLAGLIPGLGAVALLVFWASNGTPTANRYGPPVKVS